MMPYLWVKAVHVASVLIFIGGLFAQAFAVATGQRGDTGTMALVRYWDRRVTMPAMLFVWLTGVTIAIEGSWFGSGWLSAKLVFVVTLTGLHGIQSGRLRRMQGSDPLQARARIVPVAAFLACSAACIALLVVVKPF